MSFVRALLLFGFFDNANEFVILKSLELFVPETPVNMLVFTFPIQCNITVLGGQKNEEDTNERVCLELRHWVFRESKVSERSLI